MLRHAIVFAVAILIGVVFASKLRSLPLVSSLPSY